MKSLSHVQLFVTPGTVAYQAPPSMGFSMQEYWTGLPFPSPGYLPNPGIEPRSPTLQADALTSKPPGNPNSHSYPNPNLNPTQTKRIILGKALFFFGHFDTGLEKKKKSAILKMDRRL